MGARVARFGALCIAAAHGAPTTDAGQTAFTGFALGPSATIEEIADSCFMQVSAEVPLVRRRSRVTSAGRSSVIAFDLENASRVANHRSPMAPARSGLHGSTTTTSARTTSVTAVPLTSTTTYFGSLPPEIPPGLGSKDVALIFAPPTVLICVLAMLVLGLAHPAVHVPLRPARYAAELVGTFVLALTICCCKVVGGTVIEDWGPLAVGCAMAGMVYATLPVSGGHLNPATSLALVLSGDLKWRDMLRYWIAQELGALAAWGSVIGMFNRQDLGFGPVAPFQGIHALVIEAMYTGVLCFTVLNCAASKRNNPPSDGNQFYGLAIGFVLVAGGYAARRISGAAFNPAVAFALGIQRTNHGWDVDIWGLMYPLVQFVGAAVAALCYGVVRPDEIMSAQEAATTVPPLARKCIAEFLGTFTVVATFCLSTVTQSAAIAFSTAAAVISMVYSLANVSGGHINPAVTAAMGVKGAHTARDSACYVFSQLAAAVIAGTFCSIFNSVTMQAVWGARPRAPYTFWAAGFAEFFFSGVLVYVFLAVTSPRLRQGRDQKLNNYFGLGIGSVVVAGGTAIRMISGGELNPAVSGGLLVMGRTTPGVAPMTPRTYFAGFSLVQLIGGLCAVAVFRRTHPRESDQEAQIVWPSFLGEFLGTFVLVFTAGCCSMVGSVTWTATAVGCVFLAMVYATAASSGGNLNPAVTLAMGITGDIAWEIVLRYWAAQLLAGGAAGLACWALFGKRVLLMPDSRYTMAEIATAEVLFTAMLCFTALNCIASKRNNPPGDRNHFYGLAMGATMVAGTYAVGAITGGFFNPALTLAAATGHLGGTNALLWVAFELGGAVVAAILYLLIRPDERKGKDEFDSYVPLRGTKMIAELVGTFMLTLTACMNLLTGSPAAAWSTAAALLCMMFSLAGITGGYFNPAITLATIATGGKMTPYDCAGYAFSQVIGGGCAAMVYQLFRAVGFTPDPPLTERDYDLAGLAEFLFTAALSWAFLALATTRSSQRERVQQCFRIVIGIAFIAMAGGICSSMRAGYQNPAITIAILAAGWLPTGNWSLLIWQFAGGLMAAAIFRVTHAAEFAVSEVGSSP